MSSFGEEIKKIRTEKGLSIRETAYRAKMSHSYLSQLERGVRKVPSKETIMKLSVALDIPRDEMMKIAGIKEVDSFFELFGLDAPSLNKFNLKKNGITFETIHDFPINDIYFHLTDPINKKMFKSIILSDEDRQMMLSMFEAYLIQKLTNRKDGDFSTQIEILNDKNFEFPKIEKNKKEGE